MKGTDAKYIAIDRPAKSPKVKSPVDDPFRQGNMEKPPVISKPKGRLTTARLLAALAVLLILGIAVLWFAWNVWPGMNLANVVSGNGSWP